MKPGTYADAEAEALAEDASAEAPPNPMTRPTRGGARPGAGRPALPEGEGRTARLYAQVTPAERDAVAVAAEDAELTLSDWVRQAVRAALITGA